MKTLVRMCLSLAAPFCAVLVFGAPPLPGAGDEPAPAGRAIDELVAQLGDPSFAVREAAAKRLMEREDAIPALRQALKSRDPEVGRRAKEVLDALARREKERAFARLADLVKRGAVDQAVEKLVRREKWDDEIACWQLFAELAGKLTDREREAYGKASLPPEYEMLPSRDFRRYLAAHGGVSKVKFISGRRVSGEQIDRIRDGCVVRAEEMAAEQSSLNFSLLASSGNVKIGRLSCCVIFAGGSVSFDDAIGSLIVCDGDVDVQRDIKNCLIIARGPVRCKMFVINSRVISCGNVEFKRPECVRDSKMVEKEAQPLGFVKFFDPADVGIKVEKADGGVRVKEAEKGKPFAAAGLRADDLVTALDGEAVKDIEGFRRLLRAKLAVEGQTTFKVRRGEKVIEIAVPHKD